MPNEIENYAKKYKKLHPKLIEVMAPYFKENNWSPTRTRIKIVSPYWGKLSGRGSPTAAFVLRRTIYMMRGALNSENPVRNNSWNLASPQGFSTLIHEAFHTYQHDRDGFGKFLKSFFSGIWKSIRKSKKIFDHTFFDYEQEAIRFQQKVLTIVKKEDLEIFAKMR